MMKRISAKYTGIEIGSKQVKMTQCCDNCLYKVVIEPLPDNYVNNGTIVSMEAMSIFLKEMAKKYRFPDKNCAIVLPDSVAFSRRLTMPAMTVDHLKINLPYEFHDFINDRKEKYVFDYCILDMQYDENQKPVAMDLMAAAAPKDVISEYEAMVKQAGFKLQIAAPEVFAYSNLVREYERVEELEESREYCFVDFGYHSTKLHIFSGSRFEVTREIDYGCAHLIQTVAAIKNVDQHVAQSYVMKNYLDIWNLEECRGIYESIGVEIMRASNFYSFNNPESHLDTVYYCGGGSLITPLTEAVSSHISLDVRPITELMTIVGDIPADACISPASAGITYQ